MLAEIMILYRKVVVVHRIYDYVIINGFSIPCSNDANVSKKFEVWTSFFFYYESCRQMECNISS